MSIATVRRTRIITTDMVIYSAWLEIVGAIHESPAHSITTDGVTGAWLGRIGCDVPKERYDHLPAYSRERSEAYRAAQEERHRIAYAAIYAVYPHLEALVVAGAALAKDGEIVTTETGADWECAEND